MPRILPLYRERPRNPVEAEPARDCDAGCTRCWLSQGSKKLHNPCLPPEGDPGGLLVIDGYVSKHADTTGRPFSDRSGAHMRPLLRKLWDGPIAIDSAIKCYPGKVENITDEVVKQCRGYLAATLRSVKPTKVLVFGQEAMRVVLGRTVPPLSVRKGYSWVQVDGKPVPVYLFPRLDETLSNRFLRQWMEEDLKWALTTEPPFAPAWDGEARVVETLADAELAAVDIREAGWFAYDVETAGRMWEAHQIVCASLCPAGRDYAWVWADKGLKSKAIRQVMIDLLRDPKVKSVGSNMQYDEMSSMQDLKVRVRGVVGDTRLLRKILDADADADLETMAELVGMGGHKDEAKKALTDACRAVAKVAKDNASDQIELIATRIPGLRPEVLASIKPGLRTKIWAYAFMPRDICITYNALDAVSTGRVHCLLNRRRKADSPHISRTYTNTVMPAAAAVRQVSEWGMLVDAGSIESFQMYLQGERAEVMRMLERYNDGPLNPNAYEDIRNLLFKKLGLKSTALTDGGKESTENAVLEAMRSQHRVVGLVLDWRKVTKLDGTYATGMMGHIRNDGRIHPTLKLDGARSGRLSCVDPNLQTIPRDGDSATGKLARDLFIAPPGHVMVQLDYSQIELRIAAMLSGDPVMKQLFIDGEDFHWATAKSISQSTWGLTLDDAKRDGAHKQYRTKAKGVNFGLLYGQGDAALAEILGCSKRDAAKVRAGVLGQFKMLDRWIKGQLSGAKRTGYCWTHWEGQPARRRSLWKLADPDGYESSKAERGSWNTPIQGTAADYLLRSLTEVVNWILDEGLPAKLVLPVHDSVILEIEEPYVDEVLEGVHSIMTGWDSCNVPLVVDMEIGPSWGSLEKYNGSWGK